MPLWHNTEFRCVCIFGVEALLELARPAIVHTVLLVAPQDHSLPDSLVGLLFCLNSTTSEEAIFFHLVLVSQPTYVITAAKQCSAFSV
jgi:hypothetical protein